MFSKEAVYFVSKEAVYFVSKEAVHFVSKEAVYFELGLGCLQDVSKEAVILFLTCLSMSHLKRIFACGRMPRP